MKKTFVLVLIIAMISLSVSLSSISAAEIEKNNFCIVNIYPDEFHPSEISTVYITIKNIGTHSAYQVATEVLVDMADKSPIKVLGEAKQSIGTPPQNSWGFDRVDTVKYDFYIEKDTEAGIYYIPLKVLWKEKPVEEDIVFSETLYLGIRIIEHSKEAKIDILNVTTSPSVIEPGSEALMQIKLKNIGYSTINSLNVKLIARLPFIPFNSDLEEYMYDLKPGESATAYFNISVDATATSSSYHQIPLILTYSDDFGSHVKNTTIGIAVKGKPRIFIQEIILEPSKLTGNTEGLFMIRVINVGTESAEDVKIRILSADNILTEEHQFIGEIAPGESQTTTFGIFVDKDAWVGKRGLTISISYDDKFGASYSNSKIYEISILPFKELIPLAYIYAIIIIVVLSIVVYVIGKHSFHHYFIKRIRKS